ncbi:hypothetical protein [Chroococcidiopsis sp. CCNUC1]|jgi:hypothetical protein|uniref:hypothetical protein n=1 Tax=Chroococcidiopsis sp. CCNUC1 TaxID=2653189 RepID=UPI00202170A5|nr:hypothetical protein [Chroococcidiopsis sp. CCNUC1]URD53392.1 hypothetical protein M5J74_30445 [Chroococcidiopsis sp. CCNUC1]
MQTRFILVVSSLLLLPVAGAGIFARMSAASQTPRSPYVDELSSPIRGLSTREVDDLLNGRGAGFARMAELNDYPGPRHVLDLKGQLNLSAKQTQQVQAAFEKMNVEAKRLGQEIVAQEQRLSIAFADKTIAQQALQTQTEALAMLYGKLRQTHLQAHLEITPLLSPKQIATYNRLRGYTDGKTPIRHHGN